MSIRTTNNTDSVQFLGGSVYTTASRTEPGPADLRSNYNKTLFQSTATVTAVPGDHHYACSMTETCNRWPGFTSRLRLLEGSLRPSRRENWAGFLQTEPNSGWKVGDLGLFWDQTPADIKHGNPLKQHPQGAGNSIHQGLYKLHHHNHTSAAAGSLCLLILREAVG